MYSCPEVLEQLGNFLDDEVPPNVRSEIERHLAECRTCRVLYDSARKTLRLVTESRSFELSESVSERILRGVRSRLAARGRRPSPAD